MPTLGRRYVPTARDAFGPASAILAKELVNNPRAVQWCPIMVAVAYHIEDAIDAHVDGQPWLPSALIALELASRATGILHASVSDEMGFSTDAGIGCITMPLMQAIAGIVGVPAVALMGSAAPAINREPAIAADRLHDALDAALLWVSPLHGFEED